MRWLDKIRGRPDKRRLELLESLQAKYFVFRNLLESHNSTLKRISALEERYHNGKLGGASAALDEFVKIRDGVGETVGFMVELGGDRYAALRVRLGAISREVENSIAVKWSIVRDEYVLPLSGLDRGRALSVGTKSAILGELKSRLGLPIPEGYAISAWSYRRFLEVNHLNDRIQGLIEKVKAGNYQDLERASEEIRGAIADKPVPDDLAEALYAVFDEMATRTGRPFCALRSSAIGEDTSFSFAGQYLSLLNVHRETLLDQYKQIIASKFTPSAIYYLRSHAIAEMDPGMGVVCMEVVDARSSGVVYTVDPLDSRRSRLVINSIFGLGKYLVDGTLNPDVFYVSRGENRTVESHAARKQVQLRLGPNGKMQSIPVAAEDRDRLSIDEHTVKLLSEYSLRIEKQLGEPQDIEWALDGLGKLYILQARPLNLGVDRPPVNIPIDAAAVILQEGGTPICPGLGTGPVFQLTSSADLDRVPAGAVVVAPHPSPYLVAVMDRTNALITVVGGNTSHLAALAREIGVPTVVGMVDAQLLESGRPVTVDAGRGIIYAGSHPEWAPAATDQPGSDPAHQADESVRKLVAPIIQLKVIHPSDPHFTIENCRSLHDILRFVHQKSMEEIFTVLKRTSHKDRIGLRLKTKIPLVINIIYLDQGYVEVAGRRWIRENELHSLPMRALWGGVLEEGWRQTPVPADLRGFVAVIGANIQEGHKPEFSEDSYAFLSREYMLLNLRMGYHFSTIEAMVTSEPAKNYIRMQFKLGGAPLERRIRRIWLIGELLRLMGFENTSQGDFLDSSMAYQSQEGTLDRLRMLGRITVMTKQLDMALSSDVKARWYFDQCANRLNVKPREGLVHGNEESR